jgi:hypothetical protein
MAILRFMWFSVPEDYSKQATTASIYTPKQTPWSAITIPIPIDVFTHREKSKWTRCLSSTYFHAVQKPGTSGVRTQILRDIGKLLLKTHETWSAQVEPVRMESLI